MKLWVDDVRTPPSDEWLWARSVNQAIIAIKCYERSFTSDTIYINLDHDAGDFAKDGGDYIRILDWLEQAKIVDTGYFFQLHTMNPVGRENMDRIIRKNGWLSQLKKCTVDMELESIRIMKFMLRWI